MRPPPYCFGGQRARGSPDWSGAATEEGAKEVTEDKHQAFEKHHSLHKAIVSTMHCTS